MPACYAHYRFGVRMLKEMPEDIRTTVNRFRRLYDVGLHGPDPLFYYSPAVPTKVGALGGQFHKQTGEEFFERACRNLRMDPSEAAISYLYGVLGHFCLDSVCHPHINAWAAKGPANHTQIEGEFERFLLVKDGKLPPEQQDLSRHIQLTPGECETSVRFYPGVTARQWEKAVKNMARYSRWLVIPRGVRRDTVKKTLECAAPDHTGLLIPADPDPMCRHLDTPLLTLFEEAEDLYPLLVRQITAHLDHNAPLGEEFSVTFG